MNNNHGIIIKCLESECQQEYFALKNKKGELREDELDYARKDLQHHLWGHHNIEVILSHKIAKEVIDKTRSKHAGARNPFSTKQDG